MSPGDGVQSAEDRLKALIFSPERVDEGWMADFLASTSDVPEWVEACAAIVEHVYANDRDARDGYSRVALGCRARGMTEPAVRLCELDFSLGRMRRWQFIKFVESLLHASREPRACDVIESYYRDHPDAADGWAALGWRAHQAGDLERAASLYRRDLAQGRLSGVSMSRLLEVEARLARWGQVAEILGACRPVNPMPSGVFARLGWVRFEQRDWPGAIALLQRDYEAGVLDPSWQMRFALAVARAGDLVRAEQLVADAYRADASLLDGFAEIGWVAFERRDWQAAVTLMDRDHEAGRLSPRWQARRQIAAACA